MKDQKKPSQVYSKNEVVTVNIEDMGNDGEGIGRIQGYTLFIKDAVIGDEVEAKIMKAKKSYGYARLERIIKPSPFRVTPVCEQHRQCGGCQLQNISYEKQLEYKQNKIFNHLVRIGKQDEDSLRQIMQPMVGMDHPYRYRNKAQFPFGVDNVGNVITGFYAGGTHRIISNTDCQLGIVENQEVLEHILSYMKENGVRAYDESTGEGCIRHAFIRAGFATGEIVVCMVINANKLPFAESLLERLRQVKGLVGVVTSTNKAKTNVIMGEEIKVLWGRDYIKDEIGGLSFEISPLSFYQVNPKQTEKLYAIAKEYAGLTGAETVWDLYCGIGTISLYLAKDAKQVYGVEVVSRAIDDAKRNATNNGITNVEFFVGKAEELLPQKYEEEGIYADVIVVDPPRKGCDEACLSTMVNMKPERIVYISCDSATLARDVAYLNENGYELKKVCGVDQFAQGVHVETAVLLVRKG